MEDLLLLPGMMCDARMWAAQTRDLGDDCSSIRIGDITKSDSIEQIARDVLEAAPPKFALAGLSMGGIVALEVMRQAPGRISRLALLDTNAHAELSERGEQRDQLMQRALSGELRQIISDELKPVYLAEANKDDQALLNEILDMALSLGVDVFLRQSRALKNRSGNEDILPAISVPTMLLCGAEDKLCPVCIHQEMAQVIPDSTLLVVESCGHLSTMEQPGHVTAAMRNWLTI